MTPGRRRPLALAATVVALLFGVLAPVAADTPHRSVTVSVLNLVTEAPIDGIELRLYRYEGDRTWELLDTEIAPTVGGSSTFDIEQGEYALSFEDPLGAYQPGYGSGLPSFPEEGDPHLFSFDTDASALVLPDVHLRPLGPATSVIRGRVLDEHGRGVDGFEVVAYPGWPYYTGDNPQASTLTHASPDGSGHGYYELWVPAGEYDLLASGTLNGEYGPDWQGPTIIVGVDDDVTFRDIEMTPHHAGFRGKVRGGDGRGIDDVLVQAWDIRDTSEPAASALTYASTRGGGHGYYELFLPDNYGQYVVTFSDPSGRYLDRDYREGRAVAAWSRAWKELLPVTLSRSALGGVVTDQFGRALDDADVTLLRSEGGAFVPVADGDVAVLDPAVTTSNPAPTNADGSFEWGVSTGSYEVSVTSATSHGAGCFVTTTDPMDLPPSQADLLVKTTCPGAAMPAPTTAPVLSGTPKVGQTLSVTTGEWAAPLAYLQTQWLRDGLLVGMAPTYTLTSADLGKQITARVLAGRPAHVGADGGFVTFTPASYDQVSATVTAVQPASSTTTATLVDDKIDTNGRAVVQAAVVRSDAQPATGVVEVYVDDVRVGTATLTATAGGRVSLTLPRLGEGKYDVRVVYLGSDGVTGSQASSLKLKVKKAHK